MTKTHHRSITLLNVFFAFALAFAYVPMAWADNTTEAATSLQVETLLQANPYEEGSALAIVKNQDSKADSATLLDKILALVSSGSSSNELSNATQIMTISKDAYEAATGNQADVAEGVSDDQAFSIVQVTDPNATTEELLSSLLANKRVVVAEPNYLYNTDATSAQNSDALANALGQLASPQKNATDQAQSANNAIVAVMDTGADVAVKDVSGAFSEVDLTSLGLATTCAPQGLNAVTASNTANEKPEATNISDTTGHGTAVASIIVSNVDAKSLNAQKLGLVAIRVGGEANTDSTAVYEDAALRGYAFLAEASDAGLNVVAINASWGGTGASTVLSAAAAELELEGARTICAPESSETAQLTSPFDGNSFAVALDDEDLDEGDEEPGEASEEPEETGDDAPAATSLEKVTISKAVVSGDNIELSGAGFGTNLGKICMARGKTVIDVNDPSIISWTDDSIVFEAPSKVVTGTWIIKVTNEADVSGKIKAKLTMPEEGPSGNEDTPSDGPSGNDEPAVSPASPDDNQEKADEQTDKESASSSSADSTNDGSVEFGVGSSTNNVDNTPKSTDSKKSNKEKETAVEKDEPAPADEADDASADEEEAPETEGSPLLKIIGVMAVLGLIAAIIAVFYFQRKENDDKDDPNKPSYPGGFDFGGGSNGGGSSPSGNDGDPVAAAALGSLAAGAAAASGPKHAAPAADPEPEAEVAADPEPVIEPEAAPAPAEDYDALGQTTAFAPIPAAEIFAASEAAPNAAPAEAEEVIPAAEEAVAEPSEHAADVDDAAQAAFAAGATTSFTPIDVSQIVAEEKGKVLSAEAAKDSEAALDALFASEEAPQEAPATPAVVSFSEFMRSGGVAGTAAAATTAAAESATPSAAEPTEEAPKPSDTGRVLVDGRPHYTAGSSPLVEVGLSSNGLVGASAPRRIHKAPTKRRETFVRRGSRQYRP